MNRWHSRSCCPNRVFGSDNPVLWTKGAYDALSRVISVTTPDNATLATAYNGNQVLVTDQAGKQHLSSTNALGQLKDVWEVTPAGLPATETISFPGHAEVAAGYHTTYTYDVLDDLRTVVQGEQTRTFVYDSFKRLKSVKNPEHGTISYEYDDNGNLKTKTDPRQLPRIDPNKANPVTTTYVYDGLNRITKRTYNDGTPEVAYAYDTLTNGKGRISSITSSVSTIPEIKEREKLEQRSQRKQRNQ